MATARSNSVIPDVAQQMATVEIRRIDQITDGIEILAVEASRLGFGSVRRLIKEWDSGANQFNRDGECLFGAYRDGRLVGIGGVNKEPYEPESGAGRLRRFYVSETSRRNGVGSALLQTIEARSASWFPVLQLFTPCAEAGAFYESMGFARCDRFKVSHAKRLVC